MQKLLLAFFFLGFALSAHLQSAHAQSNPAPPLGHSWARVQALTANTSLHIKARTHNAHCKLKSVEADTLTCVVNDGARTEIYQRADIESIKVPHRGRSTVAGLAIGAGFGAIIGAASGSKDDLFSRGELAYALGFFFGAIGAVVGALTDFTQTTVFRA